MEAITKTTVGDCEKYLAWYQEVSVSLPYALRILIEKFAKPTY